MNERSAPPRAQAQWPAPADLLPHGRSMVFVQRILDAGPHHVACRVIPGTQDAELARDGMVPAQVSVEYMAQAIGVYAGLKAELDQRASIGFVVAVRNLAVRVPAFVVGEALIVRARSQWGEGRVVRFETSIERECEAEHAGRARPLATAFVTVYRPTPEELA